MKPGLRAYLRSMHPSQRRALGSLLVVLVLSLLYSGSYAVLRLNGYLVRGSSVDYGAGMYAGSGFHYDKGGALYAEGSVMMWGDDTTDRTPLHTLRFFTPMIRIEMALRSVIWRIR